MFRNLRLLARRHLFGRKADFQAWFRSHAAPAVAVNMSTGMAAQIHVRSFISLAEDLRQSLVTNAKLRPEIGMRRWPGVR
jgi:hypothetical protein